MERATLAEMSTSVTRKLCQEAVSGGSQTSSENERREGEQGGTESHLSGRPEGGEVAEDRGRHCW
jgi:hypothetical protein